MSKHKPRRGNVADYIQRLRTHHPGRMKETDTLLIMPGFSDDRRIEVRDKDRLSILFTFVSPRDYWDDDMGEVEAMIEAPYPGYWDEVLAIFNTFNTATVIDTSIERTEGREILTIKTTFATALEWAYNARNSVHPESPGG